MSDKERGSDWQVLAAIALIAVGALLLLDRVGGEWWDAVREAFGWALSVAWPLAVIALGVLLLVSAKRGGLGAGSGGKRLYRSRRERMIGGVLGGLGDYLGVDPTWVRIAYVVLAVATGFGPAVVIYIIAMIVIPEEPKAPGQPAQWPQAPSAAPPVWAQQPPGSTETVQTPVPPTGSGWPEPPAPSAPPAPPAPPQG